jgi:hypothetical protein
VTGHPCGWPLDDGAVCAEPVGQAGQRCGSHRITEAAAKAAAARAAARSRHRAAPPEPPPLADDDAAAIFAALDRHRDAYVVIGGMAAAMWGSDLPRTTDVDITPAADADNLDRLAAAPADLGARLRVRGEPQGVPAPLDAEVLARRQVLHARRHRRLRRPRLARHTPGCRWPSRRARRRPRRRDQHPPPRRRPARLTDDVPARRRRAHAHRGPGRPPAGNGSR